MNAYRNCKWCHGSGCLACEGEAKKAYAKAFPNGPEPLATISVDDKEGMAKLAAIISRDGIEQAKAEALECIENTDGIIGALQRIAFQEDPRAKDRAVHEKTVAIMTDKIQAINEN